MERKFKVGDRVKVFKETDENKEIIGKVGTIKDIEKGWYSDFAAIEFDEIIKDGHNCNGVCANQKGWRCDIGTFEHINTKHDKLIFRDNATILIKDGKRYIAKCCEGDTYDREKGLLVCLAKASGYTFDDLQKILEDAEEQGQPKENKVKEVKRKAKVGEYIKIVKPFSSMNDYNKGDILKVKDYHFLHGESVGVVVTKEHCVWVKHEEYVVLENYKPNKYKITLSEFWKSGDKLAIKYKNEKQGKLIYDTLIKKGFCNKINHHAKYAKDYRYILNDKHCIGCFINQGCAMDDYKKFNFNEVDLNN